MKNLTPSLQSACRRVTWPFLALPGLILLAFALRVYQLPAQSLWYDEGVSWYLTRMSLPALTLWTADDIQPPLYYYLLWLWTRLAGTTEYALRFPSVFFGTLTAPLIWITARRLVGNRAAWLALLFLALSPLHVYYAQEARMYTLLTFLGLLSSCLWVRLFPGLPRCHSERSEARPEAGRGESRSRYTRPIVSPGLTCHSERSEESRIRESRPFASLRGTWLRSSSVRSAGAYVLVMAAALYTHYFAFFLLVAHAVYLLYQWGRHLCSGRTLRPHRLRSISIVMAVFLLYLPWLPFLITRYGVDTSYWEGNLSLGEIARKLFIAFSLGETVKEGIALWLGIGYGVILLISLAALMWNVRFTTYAVRHTQYEPGSTYSVLRKDSLVFLILYLAVPVALILLLTARTPKFNPRYAMLASPAFILLISGGLAVLIGDRGSGIGDQGSGIEYCVLRITYYVSRFTFHVSRLFAAAALIYILVTSVYSLSNWFAPYRTNQFNKADFRITAGIVRERIGRDETVLLSSGHMFPAWAYYYGWEGWHRLPDSEILDVNAALDLAVGEELNRLLRGKRGLWLVRWQNQVTDPFDVLPLYLGTIGTQDDYGQFWHMELFHYSLPPDADFSLDQLITQPSDVVFGGTARLMGTRRASAGEVILFWQALADMDRDYTIFMHLLGANGETLVNADHLPPRPTREWRPGQMIPDRVKLGLPPGLPAGDYRVEVGLYDTGDPALPRLSLADGSGDRAQLLLHLEATRLD